MFKSNFGKSKRPPGLLSQLLPAVALWIAWAGCEAKALAEEQPAASDVLFIVVAPGITSPGSRCDRPVDMSVLYPTLLELCGLPDDPQCDGQSIVPLLRNLDMEWRNPAIMTYGRGNHAVRSPRWRYIRYADGSEERYDHEKDLHEWNNLAGEAAWADVIEEHRKWLPRKEAKQVADLRPSKAEARKIP